MKHARTTLITGFVLILLVATNAQAADLLGLYVGAGGGRADLRPNPLTCLASDCSNATVAGWTTFAGIQPLQFLGAELQYLDFGHMTRGIGEDHPYYQRASAAALFATGTVPLSFVDLYAKAGAGLVRTRASAFAASGIECILHSCEEAADKDATRFGWGLGARFRLPKLSSLALRAEYVRFNAPNGDPDLLSVALMWKF
jgi:opacity protein-like surface antigen